MAKGSFVRISSLLWADILVGFAFFVMQNYLTDIWGLSFTRAAAIMNFFGGICLILPLLFLYLVDELLGNFGMLVLSSISYSIGIGFVFLSTPPIIADSTGTCKQVDSQCIGHTQKTLFYTGMALVAIGVSGNKISVKPFLDEQKDETEQKDESKVKLDVTCGQIAGLTFVVLIATSGAIALPYIKPWSLRFGIPAFFTFLAMFLFLSGSTGPWKYKMKEPKGSPITRVCRVFVVCFSNISKPLPLNAKLYKQDERKSQEFTHTRLLRCLHKASIINTEGKEKKGRKPCSVAEVEEAKIAVRMIPVWMTFIMCGIVSSIGNTYFVEQANHMNRKIGKWNVPLQMLLLLYRGAKIFFTTFANKYLLTKGNEPQKGKAPVVGIAVAMIFSVLCCITAAKIEKRRLNVIIKHGLLDKPDDDIPMTVYWLLFQFFLLAGLDAFLEKSVVAFYAYQAPKSMRDYLEYFTNGVTGLGFMFSVLSVYVVGQVSENGGKINWFQDTLNRSRLDRYYWVLAVLSSANLVVFIGVACLYRYQNRDADDNEAGEPQEKADDEPGDNNDGEGDGDNGEDDDNDGKIEGSCCC